MTPPGTGPQIAMPEHVSLLPGRTKPAFWKMTENILIQKHAENRDEKKPKNQLIHRNTDIYK